MSIGCRIRKNIIRPNKKLIEAFRGIPVANIDDCMNRIACLDANIQPINHTPLLGVAFTVRCPAGDNLMLHKAMDLAKPGDVIVVAAAGSMSRSICGDIMSTYCKSRGVVGFIIDGCIRDHDELSAYTDFAVYARGVTPNGPYKNGPGEINFPVSVGGIVITPGDILIGDGDGVVVIRPEEAAGLAKAAAIVHDKEEKQLTAIRNGKEYPRPFVDEVLKRINVEYVD